MDRDDARVRAGQRDQLDVQRIVEPDIGGVLLRAGDALDGAEPRNDEPMIAMSTGLQPVACAAIFTASMMRL